MGVLCVTATTSYHVENYDRSLAALCRDVEVFHYGPDMTDTFWTEGGSKRRVAANVQLRDLAARLKSEGRLGVVFVSAYDDLLEARTLRLLRTLGAITVNYMVDMPTQWYRLWKTAGLYDTIAIAHRDFEDALRRRANDTFFLPMAASPEVYRPTIQKGAFEGPAMSFVGSWTPTREAVLRRLGARFPNLKIFGNWSRSNPNRLQVRRYVHDILHYGLPRVRAEHRTLPARMLMRRFSPREAPGPARLDQRVQSVPFAKMVELFSCSRINIGITQSEGDLGAWWAPRWVRGRDFEVPMCGGFYLVQRVPEHELHYTLGEEIEVWTTFDELVDKVVYYSAHPDRARRIAHAGRERALRDHTWERRFQTLFEHLGRTDELNNDLNLNAGCSSRTQAG